MKKSGAKRYLGIIAPLTSVGLATLYFGLESVKLPNMFGENTPPFIFFIVLGTLIFTIVGFYIGKSISLKEKT